MHGTAAESRAFVAELADHCVPANVRRFVIPPCTSLQGLAGVGRPAGILLGAQNAHHAAAGAYTGEISVRMLAALDVDLVMIGHAERRALAFEPEQVIALKVAAVLGSRLDLLLCVGEQLEQRKAGQFAEVLRGQLTTALATAQRAEVGRIRIAYEPVWAIGDGGLEAEPKDISPAIASIRDVLADRFGDASSDIPLLYGGSVNAGNCADYAALDGIDGLFVGRAAWSAQGFHDVLSQGHAAWSARQGGDQSIEHSGG